MENFLKRRENYHKTKDEIEKKERERHDTFIYELYRDWGKYETDDLYDYEYEDGKSKDDFKDNLRRVLKYWEKNEVKSEEIGRASCRERV
mgnify:CR=1 FL=1